MGPHRRQRLRQFRLHRGGAVGRGSGGAGVFRLPAPAYPVLTMNRLAAPRRPGPAPATSACGVPRHPAAGRDGCCHPCGRRPCPSPASCPCRTGPRSARCGSPPPSAVPTSASTRAATSASRAARSGGTAFASRTSSSVIRMARPRPAPPAGSRRRARGGRARPASGGPGCRAHPPAPGLDHPPQQPQHALALLLGEGRVALDPIVVVGQPQGTVAFPGEPEGQGRCSPGRAPAARACRAGRRSPGIGSAKGPPVLPPPRSPRPSRGWRARCATARHRHARRAAAGAGRAFG